MASEVLVSRIYDTLKRQVEDEYAKKLLKYKDIIEVEYSANYIPSDYLLHISPDESGFFFVNYLLEPKRLSVEFYEDTYYTSLEVNGQVTDSKGKTIFQFEKMIPVRFDQLNTNRCNPHCSAFRMLSP